MEQEKNAIGSEGRAPHHTARWEGRGRSLAEGQLRAVGDDNLRAAPKSLDLPSNHDALTAQIVPRVSERYTVETRTRRFEIYEKGRRIGVFIGRYDHTTDASDLANVCVRIMPRNTTR